MVPDTRVLLVDPNGDHAPSVRDGLAAAETAMAVETVPDTDAATDRLDEDAVDCLVSVRDLPEGDGLAFLVGVRESVAELPCVLVAERPEPAVVQRAYAAGIEVSSPGLAEEQPVGLAGRIEQLVQERAGGDSAIGPSRHFEALAETARVLIVTIDTESTIHYVNPAVEHVLGYQPEELVGEPLTTLMSDELARQHHAGVDRYLRTGEPELDWDGVELPGTHKAGHEVPLSIAFGEFERGGTRFFTGIARDVTDQRRRESRLAALNEFAQELTEATSPRAVYERTVETARRTLDLPVTTIDLYDEDAGRLEPVARTPAAEDAAEGRTLFASDRDLRWQIFVEQEGREYADVVDEAGLPESETFLRSAFVLPIGPHGVFVSGSTEVDAFDESDRHLATTLVTTARSALDRVQREQRLREQTTRLEERAEALERLHRINDVIREVIRAIGEADSRTEVMESVCTHLVDSAAYRFAWVGTRDTLSGAMTPVARAGTGEGYLEATDRTAGRDEDGLDPAGRAVRTREPEVEDDVYGDPPFEPWRREAVERGFRACAAIPLLHRDALYGVLNLFSDEAGAFDPDEVAVLEDLGETIGFAVNAIDRKAALTGERSVELAFEVGPPADALTDLAEGLDCSLELEDLVARRDESVRAFVSVGDVSVEAVEEWLAADDDVVEPRFLSEDDPVLFKCVLEAPHVLAEVVRRGGSPTEFTASGGMARMVIRLPHSLDVRTFHDLLARHYDDVELVARREREEPVMNRQDFETQLRELLTERQREVLRTAYFAGYFESPRAIDAHELAASLDVSQPTVSRHLRSGERTLLSMIFDDE